MEYLAGPLECALELQSAIHCGETVRTGALRFADWSQDPFGLSVKKVIFQIDQGGSIANGSSLGQTHLQRALFQLIERSCRGEPIAQNLQHLIDEMRQASDAQVSEFVQTLPVKLLFPVLLLQFPAFLLVLIGPLLLDLTRSMS